MVEVQAISEAEILQSLSIEFLEGKLDRVTYETLINAVQQKVLVPVREQDGNITLLDMRKAGQA